MEFIFVDTTCRQRYRLQQFFFFWEWMGGLDHVFVGGMNGK